MVKDKDKDLEGKFEALGTEIGKLVDSKQVQYGDSFGKSGGILQILYPTGIGIDQYEDVLAITRILDKLFRVANRVDGKDLGNESPFSDICGYSLLGLAKDLK